MNIHVGDNVKVMAGCLYVGEITEIDNDGFWMTENYETEEYISFLDVTELEVID